MFWFYLILSILIPTIGLPITIHYIKKMKESITDPDEIKKRQMIGMFLGLFGGIIMFLLIYLVFW